MKHPSRNNPKQKGDPESKSTKGDLGVTRHLSLKDGKRESDSRTESESGSRVQGHKVQLRRLSILRHGEASSESLSDMNLGVTRHLSLKDRRRESDPGTESDSDLRVQGHDVQLKYPSTMKVMLCRVFPQERVLRGEFHLKHPSRKNRKQKGDPESNSTKGDLGVTRHLSLKDGKRESDPRMERESGWRVQGHKVQLKRLSILRHGQASTKRVGDSKQEWDLHLVRLNDPKQ